jgi:hypothetical protein
LPPTNTTLQTKKSQQQLFTLTHTREQYSPNDLILPERRAARTYLKALQLVLSHFEKSLALDK